ncbi:MAG: penicillin-binding transpeptidase domain-containing protein [Anaerovoracaceae bacterium]
MVDKNSKKNNQMKGATRTTLLNKKRLVVAFVLFSILLFALALKIGYVQIVKGEVYKKEAIKQQTKDEILKPKRGIVTDRNGQELAVSTAAFSVWARPAEILSGKDLEEKEKNADKTAKELAKILNKDENEIKEIITTKDKSLIKVDKYLNRKKADEIRTKKLPGISLTEEVKRYYPMGNFASQLLGSVTDENVGLSGIERQYNSDLSGVEGRWVKNTDVRGNPLSYGKEKYYKPKDGSNVVLTIDQVIQSYAEKSIDKTRKETGADRVSCLIMDPKTGEVLAMASNPGYDPNTPRLPVKKEDQKKFNKMSPEKQLAYLNEMWRNPLVSDIYEPGSTAKLITTAASLEEGLTNKRDRFNCSGSMTIQGIKVKCWNYPSGHGSQNLYQGVGNSCNPVFMQLANRLGKEKYYDYLELFGLTEKTGIDFPGEATSILVPKDRVTKLDLATMGFGQTNAVTAIQLITAVSAIGNDGAVMQPHLVKALTDKNGKVVKEIKPQKIRNAISEQTADEMCSVMEYVVEKGGGDKAKIPGYRVGGKTGTAQKSGDKGYSNQVVASFMGMVPMDNPQFAILYLVDNPKGVIFGGAIAAPAAKGVLQKVLKYKDVKPEYTKKEETNNSKKTVEVPNFKGMKYSEAKKIINDMDLRCIMSPKIEKGKDVKVIDQYPKAGAKTTKNGIIYLYRK